MLDKNHQSPSLAHEELRILKAATRKFFQQKFAPSREKWIEQRLLDRRVPLHQPQ